jgi:hypothetical protein
MLSLNIDRSYSDIGREVMEVLLLHRPRGIPTPELMKAWMELGKQILTKGPLGGGKLIASYQARNQMLVICLVETPSMDSVIPICERLMMMGVDTEIIPVEKAADAAPKFEKALAEMLKK